MDRRAFIVALLATYGCGQKEEPKKAAEAPKAAATNAQPREKIARLGTLAGTPRQPQGGNVSPPAAGESSGNQGPKTDSSEGPAANMSEADCGNLWNGANKNGGDDLTGDEAKPFVDALRAGGNTGAGPTINKPDFMDACMKGTFKGISP